MAAQHDRIDELRGTMGDSGAAVAVVAGRGEIKQHGYLKYYTNYVPPVKLALGVVPREGQGSLLVPTEADALFARALVPAGIRVKAAARTAQDEAGVPLARLLRDVLAGQCAPSEAVALVGWGEILSPREEGPLRAALGDRPITDATPAVRLSKSVKAPGDIAALRDTLSRCRQVLDAMAATAAAGATTRDVVARGHLRATELGAQERLLFASTNGLFGGPVTPTAIKAGDLVTLYAEVASDDGWWAELSTLAGVGAVPAHRERLRQHAATLHASFAELVRPGIVVGTVVEALAGVARDRGTELCPGLGHGIGVDDHDDPVLRIDSTASFHAGQALALHPVVFDPQHGEYASLCRSYLVVDGGVEDLLPDGLTGDDGRS